MASRGGRRSEVTEFLEGQVLELVRDPMSWWLPEDRKPKVRTRSRVRATDAAWFKICAAAHRRNTMKPVDDSLLMKDGGAGGVAKLKEVNGRVISLQTFISILSIQCSWRVNRIRSHSWASSRA